MGGELMKRLYKIAPLILAVGLLTGCSEVEVVEETMETFAYVNEVSSYTLENDYLKMELDPETTYFTVTNKKDGSTWQSNPDDAANDPLADSESKNLLRSTLLIEYTNAIGVNVLYNNYTYSIEKGIYEIEQDDDCIKVHHTIGNTEKIFVIPPAITESRMQVFLDKMDNSGQKQIKEYYRKYDINNLRSSDDKNELLKQYPDLANECVYVIREGIQDYLKVKMETSFEAAGYTFDDYEADSALYTTQEKDKPLFNITMVYRLEGNDLVVEVPFEEMTWKESYPLTKVRVLPYLGAGHTSDNGFLLVPEGTGAVIEFNNGKTNQSAYYTDLYGWDYAMKRSALVDESRAMYGVFGISNDDAAMLCFIEEGSAFATIQADISGRSHSYNFANATYRVMHTEGMDVSAKTDKSVIVFEAEKPEGAIKQRYTFLETTDYANMAAAYRNYLLETIPTLMKQDTANVPVAIDVIGAIDLVEQRFGVPVTVEKPLTTYKEAATLIEDLKAKGYENLHIKYSGWMNGGVSHSVLSRIKTIPELGSSNDLKNLAHISEALDVTLYLNGNVQNARNSTLMDGFFINRDVAKHVTREYVKLRDFSTIWFGEKDWTDYYYLLKPQVTIAYMENLAQSATKYQAAGVSFDDLGYELGADYNPKNLTTREDVVGLQQEALKAMRDAGQKVMVSSGNDYVLGYSDYIINMDLKGSQYAIIDYNIPFYSMAIHGLVNYSGEAINLANDYLEMVLRCAETGAGLNFTFMTEPTSTLQETNYTKYFGADYEKWEALAFEIYSRFEAELGHCYNQFIVDHKRLTDGVFVTIYEDGTHVYVNYNDSIYEEGAISVRAKDFKVERR